MSASLYTELGWLPKPPGDFRKRCADISGRTNNVGKTLAGLAAFSLDENQLLRLARTIQEVQAAGQSLEPLTPFKLGILGNATLDPLGPAAIATAARHGIALSIVKADFGQTIQAALEPQSAINEAKPDAVLLALDYRGVPLAGSQAVSETEASDVERAISFTRTLRNGFRTNCRAPSILQTLAPPVETLFGNLDISVSGTMQSAISAFNTALVADVRDSEDSIFDVAALAATVGLAEWHSPTQWNMARFAFNASMLPLYAEHLCRILAAMRGKSRKCLVLDLDNTIWGGVIGDDGIDGIIVAEGDATGESFREVQRAALALRERGIVLAVSSKNSDDVARIPFRTHPEMLLREDHIAVFQANWNDKATNIVSIANELSFGLDALVFLDDNPAERGFVRETLPQVAVPELPDNPALYARTLAAAGYFEAIAFSGEDRKRADYYEHNARRATLQAQAGDLDAYLATLKMQLSFRPFDSIGRTRISQLINKSNQFNLTTRRYSELDVANFEADETVLTLQAKLVDAYGDNGMISVVICRALDAETWEIDTWLMSCRVLGRRVEQMVLREILYHARLRGVRTIIGVYRPSDKNAMVRDHYRKLGFSALSDDALQLKWVLSTDAEVEAAPIDVIRSGFSLGPS